jgi:exopolysaccharide biosynthesis polyprenyl glycosylphosphotransferase
MSRVKKILILCGDVIALYLSLALTLIIRYGISEIDRSFQNHLGPFSTIFIVWFVIFYLFDLYHPKTLRNEQTLFNALIGAIFVSAIVSIVIFYLFNNLFFNLTPKINLLIFSLIFLVVDYLWRLILARFFVSGALETIIFGNSPLINKIISYLNENPQIGYRATTWIKETNEVGINKVIQLVRDSRIQIVVIGETHLAKNLMNQLIRNILPANVSIINFWDFYENIFEKVPLDELEESWFIENITNRRPVYDMAKRTFDICFAVILGLIFLPISLLTAILIKLDSRGPVIYSQKRVGKNGKIFTLYKFRTMRENAAGPLWTEKNDPRITAFGKILRLSHLDELPQLVNIVKGDISFIGPRPERLELAQKYQSLPYYDIRHIIKPGLSGWAQINFKPSTSLEEAYEKLCYDLFYVKNRSFLLDLRIILKTLKLFITHD